MNTRPGRTAASAELPAVPGYLGLSPDDGANRRLVAAVHPLDWSNPTPAPRYNLVVVGAGTAGLVAAAGAAGLGARVALVESHLMGGDCLNVGCVPSKAIIRAGRAAHEAARSGRFGVDIGAAPRIDFARAMERLRRVRAEIAPHDSAQRFAREYGVDVFLGRARFTGPRTVQVGDARLAFKKALIATGARPAVPPVPGLVEAGFLTNETVFNLTEPPARLAVIGGGPVGCELAQAFARLGVSVTVLEQGDQVLPREDPDAAAVLRRALEGEGIDVRVGRRVARVEARGGVRLLRLDGAGSDDAVECDAILVAVGRTPNVEDLGLEAAGVRVDAHGVAVDDFLRTSNRHVFAAGDVCSAMKFTHAADFHARAAIRNALFPLAGRQRASRLVIPRCTYTDPEVAHVGLGVREAAARGLVVDTHTVFMSEVDRAVVEGEDGGFVSVHTRRGDDAILGATVVGRHAGEMISELTLAMDAGVGLGRLAAVIHPYPTRAEAIRRAGDVYNRTRLTPTAASLLRRWFAFRR